MLIHLAIKLECFILLIDNRLLLKVCGS